MFWESEMSRNESVLSIILTVRDHQRVFHSLNAHAQTVDLILLLITACSSRPVSSPSELQVEQVRYAEQLKSKRPDLFLKDCKANLIAKPEFREKILGGSSISAIISEMYSTQMQLEDKQWADEHRRWLQDRVQRNSGYGVASYYDFNYFVGYIVGKLNVKQDKNLLTHPYIDQRGVGYKFFFQLKDVQKDLRADDLQSFVQKLDKSGFQGDLKIQLSPGNTRFKFNYIVVHCATEKDCFLVESVGVKFFAGKLAGISRGVDVDIDPKG